MDPNSPSSSPCSCGAGNPACRWARVHWATGRCCWGLRGEDTGRVRDAWSSPLLHVLGPLLPGMAQPSTSARRHTVPFSNQLWGLMRMYRATAGHGSAFSTGVSGSLLAGNTWGGSQPLCELGCGDGAEPPMGTKGLRAVRCVAPSSPGPIPAPNEERTRGSELSPARRDPSGAEPWGWGITLLRAPLQHRDPQGMSTGTPNRSRQWGLTPTPGSAVTQGPRPRCQPLFLPPWLWRDPPAATHPHGSLAPPWAPRCPVHFRAQHTVPRGPAQLRVSPRAPGPPPAGSSTSSLCAEGKCCRMLCGTGGQRQQQSPVQPLTRRAPPCGTG